MEAVLGVISRVLDSASEKRGQADTLPGLKIFQKAEPKPKPSLLAIADGFIADLDTTGSARDQAPARGGPEAALQKSLSETIGALQKCLQKEKEKQGKGERKASSGPCKKPASRKTSVLKQPFAAAAAAQIRVRGRSLQ